MEWTTKFRLGTEVARSITKAMKRWGEGSLDEITWQEFSDVRPRPGVKYFAAKVGGAHQHDMLGLIGKQRLILVEQDGVVAELYYSPDHDRPGSWKRILDA